jgi:hypothetical protein
MSDRTATMSAPAKESSTTTSMTTPAATTILAIDLGKFKAAALWRQYFGRSVGSGTGSQPSVSTSTDASKVHSRAALIGGYAQHARSAEDTQMGDEGLEPSAAIRNASESRGSADAGGADSGARRAADPELQQLIELWPGLSATQRAAVLAIVRASAVATKPQGRAVGASAGKGGRNPSRAAQPLPIGGFRRSAAQQHVARVACSGSAGIGRVGRGDEISPIETSSGAASRSPRRSTRRKPALRPGGTSPSQTAMGDESPSAACGNRSPAGVFPHQPQNKEAAPVTALGGASRKRRVPNSQEGAGGK